MFKLGPFEISVVNFGFFRLDGGSMFGSVPKNIWSKRIPADAENCIRLATRSLVIKHNDRHFLIDTGMGEKWSDKLRQIYAIENLPASQWGFDPSSITDVILTHLHFDHAGGISKYVDTQQEELELCYPKATIHLQGDNLKNAKNPTVKERASYLKENWAPVEKGTLNIVNGTTEIYPGIRVHQVNGHTTGQQWIEIFSDQQAIFYPTDLIPTSHHVPLPFHMGYDICAGTLLKEKDEFLDAAVKREAIVLFQHDPNLAAAKVIKDEKGNYTLGEQVPLK
jgi:glyoxylase-like metal-dependent hydrolase (beta-lactamase superfamily II)